MRKISEFMTRAPLVTIGPASPVAAADVLMAEHAISHLLVVEEERLVGVVCACDIDAASPEQRVAACMSREPSRLDVAASAFEAASRMLREGVSCLPVMQGSTLAGIVTRSDLCRAGVLEQTPDRCAACGSDDHVRCVRHASGVGFCLECDRRSEPPTSDEDIGGG